MPSRLRRQASMVSSLWVRWNGVAAPGARLLGNRAPRWAPNLCVNPLARRVPQNRIEVKRPRVFFYLNFFFIKGVIRD
jgi:hypothetical protein